MADWCVTAMTGVRAVTARANIGVAAMTNSAAVKAMVPLLRLTMRIWRHIGEARNNTGWIMPP